MSPRPLISNDITQFSFIAIFIKKRQPFFPACHEIQSKPLEHRKPRSTRISPVKDMNHFLSPKTSYLHQKHLFLISLLTRLCSLAAPPLHMYYCRYTIHSYEYHS